MCGLGGHVRISSNSGSTSGLEHRLVILCFNSSSALKRKHCEHTATTVEWSEMKMDINDRWVRFWSARLIVDIGTAETMTRIEHSFFHRSTVRWCCRSKVECVSVRPHSTQINIRPSDTTCACAFCVHHSARRPRRIMLLINLLQKWFWMDVCLVYISIHFIIIINLNETVKVWRVSRRPNEWVRVGDVRALKCVLRNSN